jgi:chromate transporter
MERELVDRRQVASRADVTDALTHTKLLPGSTVVQVVAYLGWRLGGWSRSMLATAGFLLPSALLMVVLAYGYAQLETTPGIVAVRRGVLAVVVALLLGTMFRLAAQVVSTPLARALAMGAFAVVVWLPSASPWVGATAGLIGLMVFRDAR